MLFKVYILWSDSLKKYYVGSTQNLDDRMQRHNNGYEAFTSKGTPWNLIYSIDCRDRKEAVSLENKVKKRGIRRYLEDNGIDFGR